MEGKLHQANENRKRRMMNQHGSSNTQKYRNNSSGGFTPKYNKPTAQTYRPNYTNNQGGPPKPGGNNNNNNNNHTSNNNPNTNNNGSNNNNSNNTGPRTGSNAIPIATKDKATITCYECGVVGHYSNECPKRLAKIAANTAAPAQNQRRFAARKNQNNNGRYYNMTATEAPEAPQNMPKTLGGLAKLAWHGHAGHVPLPLFSFIPSSAPHVYWLHLASLLQPKQAMVEEELDNHRDSRAQFFQGCRSRRSAHAMGTLWPPLAWPPHARPGPSSTSLSTAWRPQSRQTRARALAPPVADDQLAGSPRLCRQTPPSPTLARPSPT
ncbi:hypothetical protein QYE76_003107 [Lolium multiflorum]|uniref:CCHC-type domain-containing protein n=1 Tax=Lolium multiflorum TaxID=4521 RepID=A0AAD8RQ90_LOLMU|nr:hypothetical protein QYE76_003107 [Lolium multiflorum]